MERAWLGNIPGYLFVNWFPTFGSLNEAVKSFKKPKSWKHTLYQFSALQSFLKWYFSTRPKFSSSRQPPKRPPAPLPINFKRLKRKSLEGEESLAKLFSVQGLRGRWKMILGRKQRERTNVERKVASVKNTKSQENLLLLQHLVAMVNDPASFSSTTCMLKD